MQNNLVYDLSKIESELDRSTIQKESQNLFADVKLGQLNEDYKSCCNSEESDIFVSNVRKLDEFLVNKIGYNSSLLIENEVFQKSINAVDLVTIKSTRTNCFTKK